MTVPTSRARRVGVLFFPLLPGSSKVQGLVFFKPASADVGFRLGIWGVGLQRLLQLLSFFAVGMMLLCNGVEQQMFAPVST